MTTRLRIPPAFVARLRQLSDGRRNAVIVRLEPFQAAPDDPKLRLRPLRCRPGHFLIDSIRYDRIILRREADGTYTAADCGGHDIIDIWERRAIDTDPTLG